MFAILSFIFNYFDDCNVGSVCNQLQGDGVLHKTWKDGYYIDQRICKYVKIDLSLLSINQGSYALINPSDHIVVSSNCHSINHFPTSVLDDSCLSLVYIYGLSSHYLNTCQVVEALHPSLMVMLGSHYLDNPSEYD